MTQQDEQPTYWRICYRMTLGVDTYQTAWGTQQEARQIVAARLGVPNDATYMTAALATDYERNVYKDYEEARAASELKIAENEYLGFEGDEGWYCISHSIDYIFGGKHEELAEWCATNNGDLRDQSGHTVNAWHTDSFQYADSSHYLPEGIHCCVESCGAEIFAGLEEDA